MGARNHMRGTTPFRTIRGVAVAASLLFAGPVLVPGQTAVRAQEAGEGQATVQASQISDVAREAINGLWSPYCPGLMLEVCSSQGGAAMRDSISIQADAGMSADAIVDYWVAEHGEKYRAEPEFSGAGRFAWLTPYLALLAGVLLAAGILAGRRQRATPVPTAEVTAEDESRLTAALAELDRTEAPDF